MKHENPWVRHQRKGFAEVRSPDKDEDWTRISISLGDQNEVCNQGAPGYIARNPENHADQWYIAKAYFLANFDETYYVIGFDED